MITVTLAAGTLLTITGIVGYLVSDTSSATALIPTAVGLLLILAALIGQRPTLRPHAMHGAMLVALLGLLGAVGNVVRVGDLTAGAAVTVSIIMAVVLAGYLAIGVRSFVAARRLRQARAAGDATP